jgi:hypothetical protein
MKWVMLIAFVLFSNSNFAQTGSIRCKVMGIDSVRIKHGVALLYGIDVASGDNVDSIYVRNRLWKDHSSAIQKVLVNRKGIALFENVPSDRLYIIEVKRHDYTNNFVLKVPVKENEQTIVKVVLKWSSYWEPITTY